MTCQMVKLQKYLSELCEIFRSVAAWPENDFRLWRSGPTNHLSPQDASEHYFMSHNLNFLQQKVLEWKFPWSSFTNTWQFCLISHLLQIIHPLQVENCDSNSRLVVDKDDNGKFRLERVNTTGSTCHVSWVEAIKLVFYCMERLSYCMERLSISWEGWKLAPAHQLMAGYFGFGPVNMTCNCPNGR